MSDTNTNHTPLNFSQITEEIYVGTNACCQLHFDRNLLSLGIEADISLEEERMDNAAGVNYFLWLPVKDHTAPTVHQLKLGIENLTYFVENSIKVYVHCRLGHGRSPTLVIGYFIAEGKSFEEAFSFVKERRSEIHLEGGQEELLRSLEADHS